MRVYDIVQDLYPSLWREYQKGLRSNSENPAIERHYAEIDTQLAERAKEVRRVVEWLIGHDCDTPEELAELLKGE